MTHPFKDLFISYGRRESLGLVGRLHKELKLAGYDVWFDKVNIPDGDDYVQRINHGIESAHNFAYVMAPRCLTSPNCLIELEYARVLGKRIIPISQMMSTYTASQELLDAEKQMLASFYQAHGLPDQNICTTQDVLDRSHQLLGKTDWLDAKEKLSDENCKRLGEWAKYYENHWAKHDDVDDLKTVQFPADICGDIIDTLDSVVERLVAVLERQKDHVHKHTDILAHALHWQNNQKAPQYLLVDKERTDAEAWLLEEFLPPDQPPCQPSTLVGEFICEARKNAENMMTDIFVCSNVKHEHDKAIRDRIVQSMSRYAKTTWQHDRDIPKDYDYQRAIKQGIENADNFFYLLSPHSVTSKDCQQELEHARKYNKRIVPLLIEATPEADIPEALRGLQYVDLTDDTDQAVFTLNYLLKILRHDQEYYEQHKILLARALKWQSADYKSSFLLRGHNLENAKTWLRLSETHEQYLPTELHRKLIEASEAAKGQLGTEMFISYSRKDGDFARQLNTRLQEASKTTWFDQESISSGVDFEQEIFKGIDGADNFVFLLSPEAMKSKYCQREVDYAVKRGKRIITVLHCQTDPETMPQALQVINWIDFENQTFNTSFQELIQELELDREHVRQHTILQQKATEWLEHDKNPDFLLNAPTYKKAEQWREQAISGKKQPPITAGQEELIQQSRQFLLPNAGFRLRCVAALFDSIFLILPIFFLSWISSTIGINLPVQALLLIVTWPYYTLLESSSWQATLGKRMVKIRVTDLQREKMSFGRANARFWSKILSGFILMIGFLMVVFSWKKQGLHDMIAGTIVISTQPSKVPKAVFKVFAAVAVTGSIISTFIVILFPAVVIFSDITHQNEANQVVVGIGIMISPFIIYILAAIVIFSYFNYLNKAKVAEAMQLLSEAKIQVNSHIKDYGEFPETLGESITTSGTYVASIDLNFQEHYIQATMKEGYSAVSGKTLRLTYEAAQKTWRCRAVHPNGVNKKYLPNGCLISTQHSKVPKVVFKVFAAVAVTGSIIISTFIVIFGLGIVIFGYFTHQNEANQVAVGMGIIISPFIIYIIVIFSYFNHLNKAKVAEAMQLLSEAKIQVNSHIEDYGEFPETLGESITTSGTYVASIDLNFQEHYIQATMKEGYSAVSGKTLRLTYEAAQKTWRCSAVHPNGVNKKYLPKGCLSGK